MEDKVNHPKHYGGKDNPYEAIKVIEAWNLGFNLGNTLKYISRFGKKDQSCTVEDLKKAAFYLDREISLQSPKELSQISTKNVTEVAQNDGEIEETPKDYAKIVLVKTKVTCMDCDECFANNDNNLCFSDGQGDCLAEDGYHFELIKNE